MLYPDSDFLARYHLHTTIHHIYLVESGMPDVVVYVDRFGIAAYLGLGLLHGSFYLCICSLTLQVFQLDDLGVLHVRENFI